MDGAVVRATTEKEEKESHPSMLSVFSFLSMHATYLICRHAVLSEVFRAISKHFVVCKFLIVCRTKSENGRRMEESIAVAIYCDYD